MSTELIISILSAVTAGISALIALRSSNISKKALSIAQNEQKSKEENLNIYLIDAARYIKTNKSYIYAFNITISNLSSLNNTIARIELTITYIRKDNTLGQLILQHNKNLSTSLDKINLTAFNTPQQIDSKSAKTSWALFLKDTNCITFEKTDKYSIRISDIYGNTESVDTYLIKDCPIAN